MKLSVGENIRQLRRSINMTQEQLAEKLNTTYQSVSRWENGTTYPDIELLPAIARIFSVTVDSILGVQDDIKQKNFHDAVKRLKNALFSAEKDEADIVSLLKEIHRDYLDILCSDTYYFEDIRESGAYKLPKVMDEVRCIFEDVTKNCSAFSKGVYVEQMAEMEDDEHINSFLKRYCHTADHNLSDNALLQRRYLFRREYDKLEHLRQIHLYELINELCNERSTWGIRGLKPQYSPEYCKWVNETRLNFLHNFNNITSSPLHPITGNGELDLFVDIRLNIGALYVSHCAACGDIDGALTAMEDWVSLFEKIMSAPEGTVLKCNSPAMDIFSPKLTKFWMPVPGKNEEQLFGYLEGEYRETDNMCDYYGLFDPSGYYYSIFTASSGWEFFAPEWLDPIRDEPRFKSALKRLEALIQTRTPCPTDSE